jgi:hypothetical protein
MKKTDYNNIKQKGHLGGPSGSLNEKVFITAEAGKNPVYGICQLLFNFIKNNSATEIKKKKSLLS